MSDDGSANNDQRASLPPWASLRYRDYSFLFMLALGTLLNDANANGFERAGKRMIGNEIPDFGDVLVGTV